MTHKVIINCTMISEVTGSSLSLLGTLNIFHHTLNGKLRSKLDVIANPHFTDPKSLMEQSPGRDSNLLPVRFFVQRNQIRGARYFWQFFGPRSHECGKVLHRFVRDEMKSAKSDCGKILSWRVAVMCKFFQRARRAHQFTKCVKSTILYLDKLHTYGITTYCFNADYSPYVTASARVCGWSLGYLSIKNDRHSHDRSRLCKVPSNMLCLTMVTINIVC